MHQEGRECQASRRADQPHDCPSFSGSAAHDATGHRELELQVAADCCAVWLLFMCQVGDSHCSNAAACHGGQREAPRLKCGRKCSQTSTAPAKAPANSAAPSANTSPADKSPAWKRSQKGEALDSGPSRQCHGTLSDTHMLKTLLSDRFETSRDEAHPVPTVPAASLD